MLSFIYWRDVHTQRACGMRQYAPLIVDSSPVRTTKPAVRRLSDGAINPEGAGEESFPSGSNAFEGENPCVGR